MKNSLRARAFAPALSVLSLAVAASLHAQTIELDPVVVTATRTEQPLTEVLSDITVIDSQTLQRGPWSTLGELIQSLPGLDGTSYGSNNVFIRGAESRMSLVLIDGIRADRQDGYINGGGAPWQLLPLESIDRVEVLRGAASGVYGADAMGGVIQIITRDGREGQHRSVSVGVSSHNTQSANVNLAGRADGWNYALQAGMVTSDGFDSKPDVSHSPSDEAWEKQQLSFALGRELSAGHHLGLRMARTQRSSQYVPWGGGNNINVDSILETASLQWEARWSSSLSSRLSLTQASTDIKETLPKDFQTVGQGVLWDNDWKTDAGLWRLTLEHKTDELTAGADGWSNPPQQGKRQQNGLGVGWGHDWGQLSAQANLRADDDELFGSKATWGGAVGYKFGAGWRVHAGTSTGYRAPTLSQLFDPQYGDRQLRPETGRSAEVGLRYLAEGQEWQAVLHRAKYANLISARPYSLNPADCSFCWYNVSSAYTRGLSLSGRMAIGASRFGLAMDWLDARNSQTGKRLNLRSPRKLSVNWELPLAGWTVRNELMFKSSRYDDAANTKNLPGYGIWNLAAKKDLRGGWSVQMRLENLLDKSYQEIKDVATPGRQWFTGLVWTGH